MPIDRDRQRGAAAVAIAVGDRVVHDFGQSLPVLECIDGGVAVVQHVAVAAVGIEREGAVGGGERRTHRSRRGAEGHGGDRAGKRCAVRTQAVLTRADRGHDVTGDGGRAVFGHGIGIGIGRGHVIDDANGERAVAAGIARVGHHQGNGPRGLGLAAGVGDRRLERVAEAELACRGHAAHVVAAGEAGQHDGAVGRVDGDVGGRQCLQLRQRDGRATDRDAVEAIGRRQVEGSGGPLGGVGATDAVHQAALQHGDLARSARTVAVHRRDRRHAVGVAVDRERERRGAGVAIAVGDRVVHHLRQCLAVLERIHGGVAVVQRVRVAAIGVQNKTAVGRAERSPDRSRDAVEADARDRCGRCIGTDAVGATTGGHHVAAHSVDRGVFRDAVGVRIGRGCVVHDLHGQRAAARGGGGVGHDQGNRVGGRHRCRLDQRRLQCVRVAQRATRHDAGGGGGGKAGQHQRAFAGVNGCGRARRAQGLQLRQGQGRAADGRAREAVQRAQCDRAGRCLALATRTVRSQARFEDRRLARCPAVAVHRAHAGRAVGATLDGDGELRGVGAACAIGEGVGVGLGQRLAALQGVDHRVAVVDGVAVAAVGVEHERAVASGQPRCDRAHRSGARGFGAGADRRDDEVGRPVVQVGVGHVAGAAQSDHVPGDRRGIFGHRPRVIVGDGAVVHRRDRDRAGQHVAVERRRPARIAANLLIVAVVHDDGVGALVLAGVAKEGRVVAGAAPGEAPDHVGDFGQRRVDIEGDDEVRATGAACNGHAGRQGPGHEQFVAGDIGGAQAHGDAARTEPGQAAGGAQVEVGQRDGADQRDVRHAGAHAGVLAHGEVARGAAEHRRVVARSNGGIQCARDGPLAGLEAHGGADVAGDRGHGRIGEPHGQAARRAVEVGDRHEADLCARGQQNGRRVGGIGRHKQPGGAIERVLPGSLCARDGGVADDRDAAEGAGRIAAASDSAPVVGGVAVARAEQGGDSGTRRVRHILHAGGQRAVGPGRPIIHIGHAGRQRHRPRAVERRAAIARTGNVHARTGHGVESDTVVVGVSFDQAHGQCVRRAVEVGGRHEAQLCCGCEHQRVRVAAGAHGCPGRAVERVLPFALRRIGRKAIDRHPEEAVGGAAARAAVAAVVDGVGRIGEMTAEQGTDRCGARRGTHVLGHRRKRLGGAVDHHGRVVERIDGEAEGACGDEVGRNTVLVGVGAGGGVVARRQCGGAPACVAFVVDDHRHGEGAVPVRRHRSAGCVRQLHRDGVDAAVDLGQRAGEGDRQAIARDHRAAAGARADARDGEARRHRHRGRQDAAGHRVLVGHGDARDRDAAAAFARAQVAGRNGRRVVDGRWEQRLVGRRDVVGEPPRNGRVRIDRGRGGRHGAVARVVVQSAIGCADDRTGAVAQTVVGDDLDAEALVAVGQAAAERNLEPDQIGLDLGARTADDQRAAGAVQRGVDRRAGRS